MTTDARSEAWPGLEPPAPGPAPPPPRPSPSGRGPVAPRAAGLATHPRLPTARRARHRRRPSGAPPPLPRSIGFTGKGWLVATVLLLAWVVVTLVSPGARRTTDRLDAAVLRTVAEFRTDALTDVFDVIDRVGSGWLMSTVGMALLVALVIFKRWRHLFVFLGSIVVLEIIGEFLYERFSRPRPYDVTIIGRWASYTLPAAPVAVLTAVLIGVIYTLVPAGRKRTVAKIVAAGIVGLFAVAELYLATFHPFDLLVGAALGVAIPLNAFRTFAPNAVFPVSYRRRKTAHLDVGGRRGDALRRAVRDQLGLIVTEIQPIGLAGSGGSTPLRLRIQGTPDTYVFGKLYAMSHVRADRWYKLGRTMLYGRLEDETPFQNVRRLVQYEDYAIRLLQDVGIPTAAPLGIVEMTPEREYLLVTEFFDGAQEIGEAEVDDGVIDQGLALIRQLWDAGLAHRDIKPANLLVRDGHLLVIDLAFLQVRPSPWREAVDLANMMLVLAVRTDAERVYQRALRYFSEDEIAEAFAAARGIASPSQLRTAMKRDGRDLLAQFRALAPDRQPISLQRWGLKRIVLALGVVVVAAVGLPATADLLTPAHDLRVHGAPMCGRSNLMVLMAQAVPEAEAVPCVASLPAGWDLAGVQVQRGRARFWLDSDVGGDRAVEATLLPAAECQVSGPTEVPSDEMGTRRFERPERLPPGLRTTRTYLFAGGCVTYRFVFDADATASLMFVADSALAFQPRAELVEEIRNRNGLRLCGAGAPCPGGS